MSLLFKLQYEWLILYNIEQTEFRKSVKPIAYKINIHKNYFLR